MKRRAPIALAGLVAALAAAQGCHRQTPLPLGLVVGNGGPITFPAPDEAWSERKPLPPATSKVTLDADTSFRVLSPSLDEKGHFDTKGQILRIELSEVVDDRPDGAKKSTLPVLKITPAVAGRTLWIGGSEVEFRAEKPFDPDVAYTVELPELGARSGKKLEGGWKGTFKAEPQVEVAGKTINYVPKPGHARAIVISPQDQTLLGGARELTVVYDQPIDLGLASRLVTITNNTKKDARTPVAVALRHPDRKAFEGQKIDPRFIVIARPTTPLAEGDAIVVEAASQVADDDAKSSAYTIATAPKLVDVSCNSTAECETKNNSFVRGPASTALRVKFSTPLGLGYGDGKKHLHITPAPANLYVSGYDDLAINASWKPSTTYTIRADGLLDQYGSAVPPVALTFETRPLSASMTMSEGVTLLDEGATHAFPVTTRNVERAELLLWALPKGDVAAYAKALHDAHSATTPPGDPVVVPFSPRVPRDQLAETALDLGARLERGRAYVAQVRIAEPLRGALAPSYVTGSEASTPSIAVLFAAGKDALGVHVHHAGEQAAVQVFRLASGAPVANARVSLGTSTVTTDALGSALLAAPDGGPGDEPVLAVTSGDADLMMPLDRGATASSALFPELTVADDPGFAKDAIGLLVTDRGVYRPGSSMSVKGFARTVQNTEIRPLADAKVRLRVIDPMGKDVADEPLVTSARGAITRDVAFDKNGHTGRFQVRLELDDGKHTLLANEQIRVADFETPRFKVDVEPAPTASADPLKLQARIVGRYLFGAPMGGAKVTWVLKKSRAEVKGGALSDLGLSFGREYDWWDEAPASDSPKPVTGEGLLRDDGSLSVDAVTGPLGNGPTELVLEADVSDASNRHVSGQLRTTQDPFPRHAGLKLAQRFSDAGRPLHVDLGVVDASGNTVSGSRVTARLERLSWSRVAEKAASGAVLERWKYVAKQEGSCEVTSGTGPVGCDLPVPHGGTFRVVARVDGRDDASTSFWAYGSWLGGDAGGVPSQGKKVPLVLDKARYQNGETAKLLVQSPFKQATALVTFEQGGIVRQQSLHIDGPSATIDVPVTAANAPWVHAAVTLLPIGASEADYRVGVVRIPVGSGDAKLDVKVTSTQKVYGVRDDAEIIIEVKKNGQPVRNADVTLGVVDEGVLRMTAYHPKDPVTTLRPGRGLDFRLSDSRSSMLRRREKAHTAGDGDGGEESLDTRKSFVETAAWLPDLVTDNDGRIKTTVKLPDNLTEFRMTAVAIDEHGGGGTAEASFLVTRPLMLEPVMPRFALRGDTFEAAALVHNNTDAQVVAQVTIDGEQRDVTLLAKSRARVAVPMTASTSGTRSMHFALAVGGAVRDRVEVPLRIDDAGLDEHPMTSGVFAEQEDVHLAIPADALFEEGAMLSIKTGSALYPELGQRLSYLLGYPHGCVEQTTSSTLPLLAARTILPWTGFTSLDDAELRKRIEAGIARLATMQTAQGGLSYWPGESEPNVFGSAYAYRALVRARAIGIERPKLIDGVTKFLVSRLYDSSGTPELRMSIAEALAESKELPPSSADSLYDLRDKADSFGLASLALALSTLPNQESRVQDLLTRLEASFDVDGAPTHGHDQRDWYYWSSEDRDRAQATIALVTLRRGSHLLPVLGTRLSRTLERYSTQSAAWSLLALSDYVGTRNPDGGVDVRVKLEGKILDTFQKLGGDNKEIRVPLALLAGKNITLRLSGDPQTPSAFALEAHYKRPLNAGGTRLARRAAKGVSIHRAYSDAEGKELALDSIKPGQIVRIAVRIDMPQLDSYRLGYLAVTDRLPAGFEPIDTDLATTGSLPELNKDHPFFEGLSSYGSSASHVDQRDDRIQLYFDHVYGGRAVFASYLARAVTAGTFTVPPASGELMYEADSEGYTDATKVVIK